MLSMLHFIFDEVILEYLLKTAFSNTLGTGSWYAEREQGDCDVFAGSLMLSAASRSLQRIDSADSRAVLSIPASTKEAYVPL
jgi:hypothetical protein